MRFEALNRLWQKVSETSHDFRVSTQIFPALDVDRVARDLELERKASERGASNEPPSESTTFDEVELAIIERIEAERTAARQQLEDQLQTFGERLTNLDFEGQFGAIRQANATTVTDYIAECESGVDDLHGLRRGLNDAEQERAAFRDQHRLRRAARVQSGTARTIKVLILVVCVMVETILNGFFLSAGSDQGIVGGVTIAISFAVLNVGVAFGFAFYWIRLAFHRNSFLKFVGALGFPLCLATAGTLNLALAHYRETSEILLGEAGRAVVDRMWSAPLALSDVQSWILFGVGMFFSLVAFADSWLLGDPYPGYGGVEIRLQKARTSYVDMRRDLIENLRDIRDEYTAKIEDIIRDLGIRKREYDAIIAHRARIGQLFEQHQDQLEKAGSVLLGLYRERNRKARSTPPPAHFSSGFSPARINPPLLLFGELNDTDLVNSIGKARDELANQSQRIADEFTRAVERYRNLDELHPDAPHG